MNVIIKYDFPNNNAASLEAILDDYGITKHYSGFESAGACLYPGSDPVNFFGTPLSVDLAAVRLLTPTESDMLSAGITPGSGSAWSILLALFA
jgi:hypothetical protein